jgi:hypothetical protein
MNESQTCTSCGVAKLIGNFGIKRGKHITVCYWCLAERRKLYKIQSKINGPTKKDKTTNLDSNIGAVSKALETNSISVVAEMFGCSSSTMSTWVKANNIKHLPCGRPRMTLDEKKAAVESLTIDE